MTEQHLCAQVEDQLEAVNAECIRLNRELDAALAEVADLVSDRAAARSRIEALEAELDKVKGHRAELSERCYRKDLELDELREHCGPIWKDEERP